MPLQFPDVPEHVRAYLYRIALTVAVLLVGYGVVSEGEADLWVQVLAAVLAIGPSALAAKNTSVRDPDAGQSVLVVALIAAAVCLVLLLLLDVIHIR